MRTTLERRGEKRIAHCGKNDKVYLGPNDNAILVEMRTSIYGRRPAPPRVRRYGRELLFWRGWGLRDWAGSNCFSYLRLW